MEESCHIGAHRCEGGRQALLGHFPCEHGQTRCQIANGQTFDVRSAN